MNTVGVAMYNAAHMAAKAIEKAGEVSTDAHPLGAGGHDLRRGAAGQPAPCAQKTTRRSCRRTSCRPSPTGPAPTTCSRSCAR